jgi:putative FmdB family regulatory protein
MRCHSCNHIFEIMEKSPPYHGRKCPKCGKRATRNYSPVAFSIKNESTRTKTERAEK